MTQRSRLLLIGGVTLAAIAGMWDLPPIPQSQDYHRFADQRAFLGIPNFLNVISNAAFLLVGAMGLSFLWRRRGSGPESSFAEGSEQWPYVIFFLGVALTGLGSGYYHLAPDNARLVWDRAPMSVAFMSILAALATERISVKAGRLSLFPLVAAGIGSVWYWRLTELGGRGDLRPYIIVQFYPTVAIPLIMLLFPSRYSRSADLLGAGATYGVAKAFEAADAQVFAVGRIASGHTLKHITAALATYLILRMLWRRRLLLLEVPEEASRGESPEGALHEK
ncbi:MAG: alkaline phytoceramidase [candidate division NC10 bacterium]|nr:alkaline phytoceramidase [candidate division NC10 bacterium]